MIDIILLAFVCGVFAAGFWCGSKFKTAKAMIEAAKAWFK